MVWRERINGSMVMKLRNKKTGEIRNVEIMGDNFLIEAKDYPNDTTIVIKSLAELNEEWEDYEEPKGIQSTSASYGDNRVTIEFYSREETVEAYEKLRAWKRLKDKNFQFHGHSALGAGEITFSLDFEDMDDEGEIGQLRHDLDLLFGGEE